MTFAEVKYNDNKKHVLMQMLRIISMVLSVAVLMSLFIVKPIKKTHKAVKSSAVFDTAIDISKLSKYDTSYKDNHFVSADNNCGFTSPYGYYYFDRRTFPEGSPMLEKSGLMFYEYMSHKSMDVVTRDEKYKIGCKWSGGSFYKDKLYLYTSASNGNKPGFDVFCGNPDGTNMKKIYTNRFCTRGDCVYYNDKVYFSVVDESSNHNASGMDTQNETKIVCVDLENMNEQTVLSKKGCNAMITIIGFNKDKIYYSYVDARKDLRFDYRGYHNPNNFKERNVNSLDLKTGKRAMLTPTVTMQEVMFEGKFMLKTIGDGTDIGLSIDNLDNNNHHTLYMYLNATTPDYLKFNTYKIYDNKIFYYTAADKKTDDLYCYDMENAKIRKFTPPTLNDPSGDVDFNISKTISDGLIFNKVVSQDKFSCYSSNLCYISKEDYYAGKSVFLDFDY